MTSPHTHPAEREPPAGEAMREAVAQWLESEVGLYVSDAAEKAGEFCGPSGPIASELARLTAERDAARADKQAAETQNEALHVKLRALAPHGSCACSYDQPGDVCSHHSPALAAAEAALTTQRADHAAEVARLKAQTPFVVTNGERGEDERFRMWSGRAWVWVNSIAYAALFVRKRDANQILPDGDSYDYPDRIRALTLKEAGHE
jgi:hypothetical protein